MDTSITPISSLKSFFITFGSNTNLRNNYIRVSAHNQTEAENLINAHYHGAWAFIYDEKRFIGQPEQYDLTEVEIGTPLTKE